MAVALALITFFVSWYHVVSASYPTNVAYTIESFTLDGNECITDCVNGQCATSYRDYGDCTKGSRKAAIYYTSRYEVPSNSKCLSKCVFAGYRYSWCYIDKELNWDYCNPDTEDRMTWVQYTLKYGRCKDVCSKRDGYNYLWCHTYWTTPSWDSCDETFYYEDQVKTINGAQCIGNCYPHDGSYYWCYVEHSLEGHTFSEKINCAPSAVYYECPSASSPRLRRPRSTHPPRTTVAQYNQDIDNEVASGTLTTVTLSTQANPDPRNPVLDYTYRTTASGLRLPVRIRARVLPGPQYQHLRGTNTRNSNNDISSEARTNCRNMGMNRCQQNCNDDQCGHLVPYILGGPPDWFNIVPQTRRINVGTITNTDLEAPSIWSDSERSMRRWVEDGGSVEFQILVTYELPTTRPTGFGTMENYFRADGTSDFQCSGYWYSNDPTEDPDVWNY